LKGSSQCTVIEKQNKVKSTSVKVNGAYYINLNTRSAQNIRLEKRDSYRYSYTLLVQVISCIYYCWCVTCDKRHLFYEFWNGINL